MKLKCIINTEQYNNSILNCKITAILIMEKFLNKHKRKYQNSRKEKIMVAIPNTAKLISTAVNAKSGTTVRKFLMPDVSEKAVATVVEYGKNIPIKQRGIDAFVKIDGSQYSDTVIDRAIFSGDKIILSGSSKTENFKTAGNFNSRFKEMIDLLKKYPKLKAELISNTQYNSSDIYGTSAMRKFLES